MKALYEALSEDSFIPFPRQQDWASIFHQTLHNVIARGLLTTEERDRVELALMQREQESSTALGRGVAVPHVYLDVFEKPVIVFVRLAKPLNLGAPDGVPTRFVFVLLGPLGREAEHLDSLMHIVRLMSDDEFRYEASEARSKKALLTAFDQFLDRIKPDAQPLPQTVSEGLAFTGRPAGGLWRDLKRRVPHYLDDWQQGLHIKCLGSTIFLFFACLAPAITFGGIMAVITGGQIGVVEMLFSTAVCGMIYAVLAGQPLIILGGIGPLLIFTGLLYRLCLDLELPFLATYGWIGLWSAGFTVLLAVTDASCLMRYFTRFTDEIFAALVSLMYIEEAIQALIKIFQDVYQKEQVNHDKALLSLLLALGTFYIAISLSRFRRSRYLLPKMREFLADFGPTIALTAMAVIAAMMPGVQLDELQAPEHFGPTSGDRPWLVDLWATPLWARWAACLPAILVAVLIYLDQNITSRIINKPDHKLHKGEAYHLDLLVVGLLLGLCSLFGWPWLVAATVRSLNHLRSLATVDEVTVHGETKESILHVRETRLTGFAIHLLIGISMLLLPLLKHIPLAVLYGIFLFMGVVSLSGNQFFERLNLWIMDSSLYPATHYIRQVPRWTIHKFTALQAVCLAVLWIVQDSPWPLLGILFPLFIALLAVVRSLAARYFSPAHLKSLDADDDEPDNRWG